MIEALFNIIFPKEKDVQKIEGLSPVELRASALRATTTPNYFIESIFSYKDPLIKKLIWELKFKRNKRIAKLFAEILREELIAYKADADLFSNTDIIIIPISSSKSRARKKGFNQTELVATFLKKDFPVVSDVLVRRHQDIPQSHIKNRAKRLENVRGCFTIKNEHLLVNKHVILFDDVTTPGATVREARGTLCATLASQISAITIAH